MKYYLSLKVRSVLNPNLSQNPGLLIIDIAVEKASPKGEAFFLNRSSAYFYGTKTHNYMKKVIRILFICFIRILVSQPATKNPTLFEKISDSHSGITFNNKIIENDSINPHDGC